MDSLGITQIHRFFVSNPGASDTAPLTERGAWTLLCEAANGIPLRCAKREETCWKR